MQNRVISCLFSFVVEFANGFKMGGGGGGGEKKNSSTKNTKSSLLVPSLYTCIFGHSSEERQIRPAELGKQPEF